MGCYILACHAPASDRTQFEAELLRLAMVAVIGIDVVAPGHDARARFAQRPNGIDRVLTIGSSCARLLRLAIAVLRRVSHQRWPCESEIEEETKI